MRWRRVDFPDPLFPTIASDSPSTRLRLTPLSARNRPEPDPYDFCMSRTLRTVSVIFLLSSYYQFSLEYSVFKAEKGGGVGHSRYCRRSRRRARGRARRAWARRKRDPRREGGPPGKKRFAKPARRRKQSIADRADGGHESGEGGGVQEVAEGTLVGWHGDVRDSPFGGETSDRFDLGGITLNRIGRVCVHVVNADYTRLLQSASHALKNDLGAGCRPSHTTELSDGCREFGERYSAACSRSGDSASSGHAAFKLFVP